MATAEPIPMNPDAYGAVQESGIGSPLLSPAEVLPTQPPAGGPHFAPISFRIAEKQALPRPTAVKFGALHDPCLRLLKPITLDISEGDDSEVVLSWLEIDEFGCGATTSDALVDFGQSLRELYHELHVDGVQLGPDLRRVKGVLDTYIEKRG